MSITHIIRCDAKLANGQQCEVKAPLQHPHQIPSEWVTIHGTRKADASDSKMLRGIQPLIDATHDAMDDVGSEKGKRQQQAMERVVGGMVENELQVPIVTFAHLCPTHAAGIPQIEPQEHSLGCPFPTVY